MDSQRIEKGYRAWNPDIIDQETPLEAGLTFAVAFDKSVEFKGRDALLRQQDGVLHKRLVIFTIDDPQPLLLSDEPIYRDGVLVGRTTSGIFGHTLCQSVGMGYVENEEGVDAALIRSGSYEIEIAPERFAVTATLRPPTTLGANVCVLRGPHAARVQIGGVAYVNDGPMFLTLSSPYHPQFSCHPHAPECMLRVKR